MVTGISSATARNNVIPFVLNPSSRRSNSEYRANPLDNGRNVDIFVGSNTQNSAIQERFKDATYVNKVAKSFLNRESAKDKSIKEGLSLLENPKSTVRLFKALKGYYEKENAKNPDPVAEFYLKQLDLSIKNLSGENKAELPQVAFAGKKSKNIFDAVKLKNGKNFNEYFPKEFGMTEKEFNEKLWNVLMDEEKKFILVESINGELSKKGVSDELNIYIKEGKSEQVGKIKASALAPKGAGAFMVTARALYAMANPHMDDFDKSIEAVRLSHDLTDFMVVGGAVAAIASFNAEVAAANLANPEMFSKAFIWAGNGLVALSCLAARFFIKDARQRDEDNIIEGLKYLKAMHICMQAGYIDAKNIGTAINKLNEN